MHAVGTGHGGPAAVRPRRALGAALALALTLLAAPGSGVALANSLSASVSRNAQATVPMTITATGSATEQSYLRVFVQPAGAGCAGGGTGAANAETQAQRIGSVEVITRSPFGPFAYTTQYTPPAAGSYSLCVYLFGSTAATGASQVSQSFSVAPAPPRPVVITPSPSAGSPPGGSTGAKRACVVPRLKGRTYLGARKLLTRAGCSVGTVYRPTRTAPKGMVLRVTWQLQKAKSVRKVNSRVTLRLGFVKRGRA